MLVFLICWCAEYHTEIVFWIHRFSISLTLSTMGRDLKKLESSEADCVREEQSLDFLTWLLDFYSSGKFTCYSNSLTDIQVQDLKNTKKRLYAMYSIYRRQCALYTVQYIQAFQGGIPLLHAVKKRRPTSHHGPLSSCRDSVEIPEIFPSRWTAFRLC